MTRDSRRPYKAAKAVGNEKPPELLAVEEIICRAVESIAFHNKSPLEAANAIMAEIDWEAVKKSNNAAWFHTGITLHLLPDFIS